MADFQKRFSFEKIALNEEQRIVMGWASVVTDENGEPVVDSQGDIIPIEELEKAFYGLMANGGGKAGVNHMVEGVGPIVANFVISKKVREKFNFGPDKREGVIIAVYIEDDATLAQVKAGELPAFSISGEAERVEVVDG